MLTYQKLHNTLYNYSCNSRDLYNLCSLPSVIIESINYFYCITFEYKTTKP